MNASDAIRFLAHEAQRCRDRDAHEALCLWLPAMCRVFGLKPADDFDALAIQEQLHRELRDLNESYLVEAHCEKCGFAETVPACRFTWQNAMGNAAKIWCDQCHAERFFAREEVTA